MWAEFAATSVVVTFSSTALPRLRVSRATSLSPPHSHQLRGGWNVRQLVERCKGVQLVGT